jgi:hypothetical protein
MSWQLKPLEVAVPVIVGLAVLFLSPGGDLVTPTIGSIVAAIVCTLVFAVLLRRRHPIPS